MNIDELKIIKASPIHAKEIVNLFQTNHKDGYYNQTFFSENKMCYQLNDINKFCGLVAILPGDKVVGFYGLYFQKYAEMSQNYLANFLVDASYRRYGIGKLLEQYVVEKCNELPGKKVMYTIIHDEKSVDSISLKRSIGFDIWGSRLFFGLKEPGNIGYGHMVLMGATSGFPNNLLSIENVSKVTKDLINQNTSAKRNYIEVSKKEFYCNVEYFENLEHGQIFCNLSYKKSGKDLNEIIKKMKSTHYPYISIRIDAQSHGLHYADHKLIDNDFYPVAFLPYYFYGHDIIEYQYLHKNSIECLSEYLPNKKQIIVCLKDSRN